MDALSACYLVVEEFHLHPDGLGITVGDAVGFEDGTEKDIGVGHVEAIPVVLLFIIISK